MKQGISMVMICFLVLFLNACQSSNIIGAQQWTQYRLNKENNPVINSSKPLNLNRALKTDNQVRATPVVADNKLFVGNHKTGSLQAFDLTNGKRLWKNKASNWVHSEMVYKNVKVYVGYGNRFFKTVKGIAIRGTGPSGVLCLNAKTGKVLWDFKTQGEVMPTPVLYKNQVIVTDGDRVIHALNQQSGKVEWALKIGSVVSMSSPAEENGILYFGGSRPYTFFAIDLDKHKILWHTAFTKVVAGLDDVPPVISGNLVVTTALEGTLEEPDHKIYAMNKKTGQVVWEKDLGSGRMVPNNKSGAPMIYKRNVYVASPITKKMYAFNASTGEKLWEVQNNAVMKAPPVATNNKVFFVDTKGRVMAFDAKTGKPRGEKQLKGKLAPAGPIIVNNHMIVGSQDSNVYIFPLSDIK